MNNQTTELSRRDNLIRGVVCIHPRLLESNYILNFVKIKEGGKGCFELRWPSRVMRCWDSSLRQHLAEGGGYGVQTNNSKIIINGVEKQYGK